MAKTASTESPATASERVWKGKSGSGASRPSALRLAAPASEAPRSVPRPSPYATQPAVPQVAPQQVAPEPSAPQKPDHALDPRLLRAQRVVMLQFAELEEHGVMAEHTELLANVVSGKLALEHVDRASSAVRRALSLGARARIARDLADALSALMLAERRLKAG